MKKSKGSKKNRNRGWLILMLAVLLIYETIGARE